VVSDVTAKEKKRGEPTETYRRVRKKRFGNFTGERKGVTSRKGRQVWVTKKKKKQKRAASTGSKERRGERRSVGGKGEGYTRNPRINKEKKQKKKSQDRTFHEKRGSWSCGCKRAHTKKRKEDKDYKS